LSRRTLLSFLAVVVALAVWFASSGAARPLGAASPGSYIVVFKQDVANVDSVVNEQSKQHGFRPDFVYTRALKGYAAKLSPGALARIKADPRVEYVEPDGVVNIDTVQPTPPWGLDRIDQRNLPLGADYSYTSTGSGVTAYVIDTGIRKTHVEFEGRASDGFDAIDGGPADDCNGHGTHVAGTIGGRTYGVAKGATLKAVRVLDCQGSGTWSQVIAGLDWVESDHVAGRLAVANMSLGGSANPAADAAVASAIADGIVFGVAAGNSSANACNYTPARVKSALTVAASDLNDRFASFSNRGSCVDIIAPGVNVLSAWNTSDVAVNTISGTSMATPHIVGIAARAWASDPTAAASIIARRVKRQATLGVVTSVPANTVNKVGYWSPAR
jgi:subtilisin family serine protease